MAVRSVHSTSNERNELQALQRITAELKELQRRTTAIVIGAPSSSGGTANLTNIENSLNNIYSKESTQITLLTDIESNTASLSTTLTSIDLTLDAIEAAQRKENWDKYIGNTMEFVYYSVVEAGNPSGNGNLKQILYKKAGSTVLTNTYTYDANDRVKLITAT